MRQPPIIFIGYVIILSKMILNHGEALLNWENTHMYLTINNLITHVDNLLFGRSESRVHFFFFFYKNPGYT